MEIVTRSSRRGRLGGRQDRSRHRASRRTAHPAAPAYQFRGGNPTQERFPSADSIAPGGDPHGYVENAAEISMHTIRVEDSHKQPKHDQRSTAGCTKKGVDD